MNYSLTKTFGLVAALIFLAACAQTPPAPEPVVLLPSVGEVNLQRAETPPPEAIQLDVGIKVFANRLNTSDYERFGEWVFSEIRENEVHYLPYVLRNTLLEANHLVESQKEQEKFLTQLQVIKKQKLN